MNDWLAFPVMAKWEREGYEKFNKVLQAGVFDGCVRMPPWLVLSKPIKFECFRLTGYDEPHSENVESDRNAPWE